MLLITVFILFLLKIPSDEELQECVECLAFNQPWKQFSEPQSAYKCWKQRGSFKMTEDLTATTTEGGFAVHGDLDGDNICPPLQYVYREDANDILYYREPCDVRIWNNERLFMTNKTNLIPSNSF